MYMQVRPIRKKVAAIQILGELLTFTIVYFVGVQESGITKQDKDTQEMVANNVDINSDVKPLLSSCSS